MIAEAPTTEAMDTAQRDTWPGRYPARMADWTPEHRSRAAREGWRTRRAAPSAWSRLMGLLQTADPCAIRLYHCEVAEAVLPHYFAVCPDDPRPQMALWTARRYARGEATEAERLAAAQVMIAAAHAWPGGQIPWRDAGYAAMDAIAWTTYKAAGHAFRYALMDLGLDDAATHLAALEARIAATPPEEKE